MDPKELHQLICGTMPQTTSFIITTITKVSSGRPASPGMMTSIPQTEASLLAGWTFLLRS